MAKHSLSKAQLTKNYQFVSTYLHLDDIELQNTGHYQAAKKDARISLGHLFIGHKFYFLDEPTTGLDPQTRQFVWQAMKQLQAETNMTVFLTTHYMEEAAVAHQVIVLKQGRIVAEGTPDALKTKYAYDQMALVFHDRLLGLKWLRKIPYRTQKKLGIFYVRVSSTLTALTLLKSAEPLLASFEVMRHDG
ncbi:ABC transporter OS=Lysinibacillus sphaericus OX=1421 GN=LS41612_15820 PE=4 SV=1 [Lysinibacillus sphaericus]